GWSGASWARRARSPRSAPPVRSLLGSVARIATVSPRARRTRTSASISELLPAPPGPVSPTRSVLPARASAAAATRSATASKRSGSDSASESSRASARRSPPSMRSSSAAGSSTDDMRGILLRVATLASVNVSPIPTFEVGGRTIRSGTLKAPVAGRVRVRALGVDGDAQADRRFHGGTEKAVYVYGAEHYDFWRSRIRGETLAQLGGLPFG